VSALPTWLYLAPFILAYVIALPVLFLTARDAWRDLRAARDPRCPHCGPVLPCGWCWRERL
jgi:hypothetical protein